MGIVETVTGPVRSDALGLTLVHEHLIVDHGELHGRPKKSASLSDRQKGTLAGMLTRFRDAGGQTIVDCTPIGQGRYVDQLAELSHASEVRIVAATGFYSASPHPLHHLAKFLPEDAIVDLFVRELTEGIGATAVHAGLIKIASGRTPTSVERKVIRAAGRAAIATGSPIVAHAWGGAARAQLRLLEHAGADRSRILFSHVGTSSRPQSEIRDLAQLGTNIGIDQIGYRGWANSHWLDTVLFAIGLVPEQQLFLSHDSVGLLFSDKKGRREGPEFDYILAQFIPMLRASRIRATAIRQILIRNPARFLARSKRR